MHHPHHHLVLLNFPQIRARVHIVRTLKLKIEVEIKQQCQPVLHQGGRIMDCGGVLYVIVGLGLWFVQQGQQETMEDDFGDAQTTR